MFAAYLLRIGAAVGVVIVGAAGCGRRAVQPADAAGIAGAGGAGAVGGLGGGTGSGAGGSGAGGSGAGGSGVGGVGVGGVGVGGSGVGGSGVGGVGVGGVGAGGVGAAGGAVGGGPGGGAAGAVAGSSGTGGVPATCAEACAPGLVCARVPPPSCADPQWVAWPMPNGKVDVAAGAPNEMSFTDNSDGTVTDNVTHLMWQQATPADSYDFDGAGAFCRDLTLAGHDDWRLPSQIELVSIADLGRFDPAIDTTVFPGTPSDFFWSSTIWGTSPATAGSITFARGSTRQQNMTMRLHVRCVR